MSSLSQFAGGGAPVGSIIQAPFNLTDPAWLPCDGRILNRADYPLLSACMPGVGVFTSTSRTRSATPTGNALATNGAVWVMTGAAGTSNILTTPDGVTYTPGGVPEVATDVRSLIYDGVNFVGVCGDGGSAAGVYSADGGDTWAKSGAAGIVETTALQSCMAHAPSLGTVGRFCVASLAYFYTSDNRGVTWIQRAHNLGGKALHVCWTGLKFIALTDVAHTIYTSADGITWVKVVLRTPLSLSTADRGSIASDGAGNVVIVSYGTAFQTLTSTDHGATWSLRYFATQLGSQSAPHVASFTGGKFFIAGLSAALSFAVASVDLSAWSATFPIPDYRANFSYKSGVYYGASMTAATDATLVEDSTKIQLPFAGQGVVFVTSAVASVNNNLPWIKVK